MNLFFKLPVHKILKSVTCLILLIDARAMICPPPSRLFVSAAAKARTISTTQANRHITQHCPDFLLLRMLQAERECNLSV